MIASFADKETERFYRTGKSKRFSADIHERALMRLQRLDAATVVDDLGFPPSHHLEKLRGDRAGQWSIRITWKNYAAIEQVSGAFASIINGACVFLLLMEMPKRLK